MSKRPPTGLVYGISALILVGVVITTVAFGLGVRIAYGSGIGGKLGSQVERDFLGDQNAEATALSSSDPSAISRRLTGNALEDVNQQISDQTAPGAAATVSFQPASLTVMKAQDSIDPSLVIEVQEDGTKTITTSAGPNSVPTQQTISFHGNFWLRQDASGRYLIADQSIQNQPSSNLPAFALMAVALVWIGLAALLVRRRQLRPLPAPVSDGLTAVLAAVAYTPPAYEPTEAVVGPPHAVVIRTFGGLRLEQDGQDWAADLKARPVTAFIWLRLLLAAIHDPYRRPSRDELGRQASPGYDRENQLKQMRNIVYKLRELPPALRDRIRVEPQVMSFKEDGCDIDAINLLRISAECAGRSVLALSQLARVRRAIDAAAGVFLPEFESVEDIATDHHPTCGDLIREQRDLLAAKRLELIVWLADSYTATNRPAEAIAILEPALANQSGRDDLRARLAAAYSRAEAAGLEAKQRAGSAVDAATWRPR
jgi:hypothetical protein